MSSLPETRRTLCAHSRPSPSPRSFRSLRPAWPSASGRHRRKRSSSAMRTRARSTPRREACVAHGQGGHRVERGRDPARRARGVRGAQEAHRCLRGAAGELPRLHPRGHQGSAASTGMKRPRPCRLWSRPASATSSASPPADTISASTSSTTRSPPTCLTLIVESAARGDAAAHARAEHSSIAAG